MTREVIDLYRGTHRAVWDEDHIIREVRVRPRKVKTATRVRELLQAVLVALVALAVVTAKDLQADQQIALAIAFLTWPVLYGMAAYWESRR